MKPRNPFAGPAAPRTPVAPCPHGHVSGRGRHPDRLLASNGFQCHGTLGRGGFDNIRGGEAGEVREYLGKTASADIMAAHAQGYTPAQLDAIVKYLNQP